MSVLLFHLNGVPNEEADEVRVLLEQNNLAFFETNAGKWGISTAAIWLKNKNQLETAQSLIREYENERTHRIKEEFKLLKQEGKVETFLDKITRQPLQIMFYLAIVFGIAYLSIKPFFSIGKQ